METATAETTPETSDAPPAAAPLAARLRARFDGYRAQARELPTRARGLARARAQALVTRVRIALDLPSRSEIAELTARLEELDRRIGQLAAGQAVEVPSLEAAPADAAAELAGDDAPETGRKDKRRTAAAKTARR